MRLSEVAGASTVRWAHWRWPSNHRRRCCWCVSTVSRGDKLLDSPLSKIGGKGLFVKELPNGMNIEWTDLSFQQATQGNTALIVFPVAVLLAFLVLARRRRKARSQMAPDSFPREYNHRSFWSNARQ